MTSIRGAMHPAARSASPRFLLRAHWSARPPPPLVPASPATADAPPRVGIVCTPGSGGVPGSPIFNLTTKTGYISLPDGNTAFMWGYSSGFDGFQHPGPVLCVNAGRHRHGDPAQHADRRRCRSCSPARRVSSPTARRPSPSCQEPAAHLADQDGRRHHGGTVTYSFVGVEAGHVPLRVGHQPREAGPDGPVRCADRAACGCADRAYDRSDSQFTPSEEFMVLLSEIDPYQHQAVEQGKSFNLNNYHPRYWLINGRGFPDSIADNYASWLPTQPYGVAGRGEPVRPCHSPAPWTGALPQRRHRGLSVPPARQQRAGDRAGRPRRSRARPARTCPSRSSPSTSGRARPGTCSSSGTTPSTTTPTPTRCR